jgi:hypothetical protein
MIEAVGQGRVPTLLHLVARYSNHEECLSFDSPSRFVTFLGTLRSNTYLEKLDL